MTIMKREQAEKLDFGGKEKKILFGCNAFETLPDSAYLN